MSKKTQALIARLANEATAVRPMGSPLRRALWWLVITVFYFAALLLVFFDGPRVDFADKLGNPLFLLELTATALTAISACFAAMCLAAPDGYQKRHMTALPLFFFALLTGFLCYQFFWPAMLYQQVLTVAANGLVCAVDMLIFSIFPIGVLLFSLRRAATTQPMMAALMACLAAVALSYLSLRVIESDDRIVHLLLWHYVPMVAVCVAGVSIGRRLLRW